MLTVQRSFLGPEPDVFLPFTMPFMDLDPSPFRVAVRLHDDRTPQTMDFDFEQLLTSTATHNTHVEPAPSATRSRVRPVLDD